MQLCPRPYTWKFLSQDAILYNMVYLLQCTAWRLCLRTPILNSLDTNTLALFLSPQSLPLIKSTRVYLVLHLRLGIYRRCLKRVGLVPNPRSLLSQRNLGFAGGLDTVVRADTAA